MAIQYEERTSLTREEAEALTPLEALTPEQLEALKQEAEAIQAEVAASIEKLKKIHARNQPHEAIYHGIESKWFPLQTHHVYRDYGNYDLDEGTYDLQRRYFEPSQEAEAIQASLNGYSSALAPSALAGIELTHAKNSLETVAPATAFTIMLLAYLAGLPIHQYCLSERYLSHRRTAHTPTLSVWRARNPPAMSCFICLAMLRADRSMHRTGTLGGGICGAELTSLEQCLSS